MQEKKKKRFKLNVIQLKKKKRKRKELLCRLLYMCHICINIRKKRYATYTQSKYTFKNYVVIIFDCVHSYETLKQKFIYC